MFKLKLKPLEDEIYKDGIFGQRVAHRRVIAFQKRGLPHAHLLIILRKEDKFKTAGQVDDVIGAKLPPAPEDIFDDDPSEQMRKRRQENWLEEIVVDNMVHGPCGETGPSMPCMFTKDGQRCGKCAKGFPKEFQRNTIWDESRTDPTYRRRSVQQGGRETLLPNNKIVDNRWIVPYCPYLSLKYNCHINVEICVSPKAIKYLYKYIQKGGDRVMPNVTTQQQMQVNDEIKEYRDVRSFGASEGAWKLFENPMSDRFQSVVRLRCHLKNHDTIYFYQNAPLPETVDNVQSTEVTAFFKYNADHPTANIPYIKFPERFTFDKGVWKLRQRGSHTIGRIHNTNPRDGDYSTCEC